MSRNPGRETVQVITLTFGPKDAKGNRAKVESPPFSVQGCSFQPLAPSEVVSDTDMTISVYRLYMPIGTVVTATDRIIAGGVKYEVLGDPMTWTNLRGQPDHMVCELRLATG